MKKIFLLLSMITMFFATMAKETPYVIVHKSNGGFWAWLNLYNDILYTPSADETQPATLECTGAGFSFCRVPRADVFATNSLNQMLSYAEQNAIADAINNLIEESENMGSRGIMSGQKSRTVAITNSSNAKGCQTYFVKGVWEYSNSGEGTMRIYVNKSNLLSGRN